MMQKEFHQATMTPKPDMDIMKALADSSAARIPVGKTPVTPALLAEMAAFSHRWKKRHPLGTREQLEKAASLHFNVEFITQPTTTNEINTNADL